MAAYHGDKRHVWSEWLKKVSSGKLCVIRYRVCAADLKFNPKTPAAVFMQQQDIRPRRKT
jgi:hypothetical protein